jgi:hypothetical protein
MHRKEYYKLSNLVVYLHAVVMFFPNKKVFLLPSGHSAYRTAILLLTIALVVVFFVERRPKDDVVKVPKLFCFFLFYTIVQIILIYSIRYFDLDPVKDPTRINTGTMISGPLLFVNGLLVSFVVLKNRWGYKEFERVFNILLVGGAVVAVECILTFYIGLFPGVLNWANSSDVPREIQLNVFRSIFIYKNHVVGSLGIVITSFSLYVWAKSKRKMAIVYLACGLLLATASDSRAAIFPALTVVVIFTYLAARYNWLKRLKDVNLGGIYIMVASALTVIIFLSVVHDVSKRRSNIYDFNTGITRRFDKNIRALDVFVHRPLGTGLGLNKGYLWNKVIPETISRHIEKKGDIDIYGYYGGGLHNGIFDITLELGWVCCIYFFYLLFWEIRVLIRIPKLLKKEKSWAQRGSVYAIYLMVPALFVSIITTSSVQIYWLFGVLIIFQAFIYKDLCKKVI